MASNNLITRQSSIEGREGVDVYVGGNTDLKGSKIVADNGNLKLDTGTLSWSDMKTTSKSIGGNLGFDYKSSRKGSAASEGGNAASEGANAEEPTAKKKELPPPGTWVTQGAEWASDTMNNVSKKLQNFAYHPKDIRAEVSGIEQVARATVGSGSIVIRNNPEQDISGLNRNPDRAMTESSPKWSNMRAHWQDPFGDVANAASSLKKGFNYSQTFEHEGFASGMKELWDDAKKEIDKKVDSFKGFFKSGNKENQPEA